MSFVQRGLLAALSVVFINGLAQTSSVDLQGPGNILVSTGNSVVEFTPDGTQVSSFDVEYPGGNPPTSEWARDIVLDKDGDLHVFNGTFSPYVSTRRASDGQWEHHDHDGWDNTNTVGHGGISVLGDYVFVSDDLGRGNEGLVRFDTNDWSSVQWATHQGNYDVCVGRDGLVYALRQNWQVHIYHPEQLTWLHSMDLSGLASGHDKRGIAVDADGQIFVATWEGKIFRCSPDGRAQEYIEPGPQDLTDIDLDPFGNLVVGSRFGTIIITDTTFSSWSTFDAGDGVCYVAFTDGMGAGANFCSSVPNSTTQAARITATGSHSLALDDLTLEVGPIPNNFYIFYVGPGEANSSFGNGGSLCVGGGMLRYPALMSTENTGSMSVLPGEVFAAGDVARFQCWFRDPSVGPDYFNSSDGYVIQFVP